MTRADLDQRIKRWNYRPVASRLLRDLYETIAKDIGAEGYVDAVAQALARRGFVAVYADDCWTLK